MTYGWRTVDGRDTELCDECGFDAREVEEEVPEFRAVFGRLVALGNREDAERRPEPEIFSALEYLDHSIEATAGILAYVARALGNKPPTIDDFASAEDFIATTVPALTGIQRAALLRDEYPFAVSVEWLLRHLLHDLQHHVLDIRRGYARLALTDLPEIHTVRRERPL